MTDLEILEFAAKAAGIPDGCWNCEHHDHGHGEYWNPLEDDSHAFRLAVELKIIITFADAGDGPYVCAGQRLGPFSRVRLPVKMFALEEEFAATRRVISMAAAEIGRLI